MQFRSIERVERGGYLVYALGDEIPASDVDELIRQGHIAGDTDLAEESSPDSDEDDDAPAIGDEIPDSDVDELAVEPPAAPPADRPDTGDATVTVDPPAAESTEQPTRKRGTKSKS